MLTKEFYASQILFKLSTTMADGKHDNEVRRIVRKMCRKYTKPFLKNWFSSQVGNAWKGQGYRLNFGKR